MSLRSKGFRTVRSVGRMTSIITCRVLRSVLKEFRMNGWVLVAVEKVVGL